MRTLNFYKDGVLKYSLESDKPLAQIKTHATYYYLELDKLYLVETQTV